VSRELLWELTEGVPARVKPVTIVRSKIREKCFIEFELLDVAGWAQTIYDFGVDTWNSRSCDIQCRKPVASLV
jgi:hypothetical protein